MGKSEVGCVGPDDLVRAHGVSETCDVCAGTTNGDAPFQPGERVLWADEVFTVVDNQGSGGVVEDTRGGRWYYWWYFDGEHVRRLSQ